MWCILIQYNITLQQSSGQVAGSKVYSLPDCNKMQKVDDDFQLQVEDGVEWNFIPKWCVMVMVMTQDNIRRNVLCILIFFVA